MPLCLLKNLKVLLWHVVLILKASNTPSHSFVPTRRSSANVFTVGEWVKQIQLPNNNYVISSWMLWFIKQRQEYNIWHLNDKGNILLWPKTWHNEGSQSSSHMWITRCRKIQTLTMDSIGDTPKCIAFIHSRLGLGLPTGAMSEVAIKSGVYPCLVAMGVNVSMMGLVNPVEDPTLRLYFDLSCFTVSAAPVKKKKELNDLERQKNRLVG